MKALVEATPISGPASVGAAASVCRAMLDDATLTTPIVFAPVLLDVAQRGERVGRLARLRNDDRETPTIDRRLAVSIFRRDIDLDRETGEPLDPVFGDEPGHMGGAAADDRDAAQGFRVNGPDKRFQPHCRHVDVMGERVAHDFGLLVDLLRHEVAVIALLRQQAARRVPLNAALDRLARTVVEVSRLAAQDDPIALFEIGDAVGERGERQRIGAEIHFSVAIADRERGALPRADQKIVLALEQIDEREGAAEAPKRRMHGLGGRLALGELVLDDEGGDLGIGLGRECVALRGQFLAQRLEILDDAVVHDGEARRGVRMGVRFVRLAVGRPARVADADRARQRRRRELRLEVLELALGAPALDPAVFERRDPGRIVAPDIRAASSASTIEPATGPDPKTPTIPHIA